MASFQQAQQEGLCLRYPSNFGLHPSISYDMAGNMLLRAIQISAAQPYQWDYIDKPSEGQVELLFLAPQQMFPNDGIRYLEGDVRAIIPLGPNRDMEVVESKYGFIPNSSDTQAWRVRRRYRFVKGGHSQIVLVHYSRGQGVPINPAMLSAPVRQYPLRSTNEPAVFVLGEKMGQKVYPPGHPHGGMAHPPGPGQFSSQQAMLAQANSRMAALERERGRGRSASGSGMMGMPRGPGPAPPGLEDDDSADEADTISTRTLAATRYRRNHEIMNEVFQHAAFGDKRKPPPPTPYSIFNKDELEEKTAKLAAEIEALKEAASARKAKRDAPDLFAEGPASSSVELADVSMGSEGLAV